jgi:hypothetical protein
VRIAPDILSFTANQVWSGRLPQLHAALRQSITDILADVYGPRVSDSRGNIPRDPGFVQILNPDSIV